MVGGWYSLGFLCSWAGEEVGSWERAPASMILYEDLCYVVTCRLLTYLGSVAVIFLRVGYVTANLDDLGAWLSV